MTETPVVVRPAEGQALEEEHLSKQDRYRLTLYKWRYTLEAVGFEGDEVGGLMFVKWLYSTGRLRP